MSEEITKQAHCQYDDSQRLSKVTDPTATREFTYNIKGQILTETVTLSAGNLPEAARSGGVPPPLGQSPSALPPKAPNPQPLKYQITRTYYDEFCAQCAGGGTPDQPKQVTLTGMDGTDLTHQVSYEWDIRGNLAKVESPAGTFTYTYDAKNPSLLSSLQAPAHKVEYQYEPHRNLVTSVKNLNASNQSVISSYGYENDLLGRRTQITQRGSAFDLLQLHGQSAIQVAYNDRSEVTGYEIAKLLEGAKPGSGDIPVPDQPQPKPAANLAQTYAYDSIGNRTQFLTESSGEKTNVLYQSNALNQYTQIADPDFTAKPTHDPDGNLLDDHRNNYTWNAENRLVKVEAKDGSYTIEKSYDYQGRKTTEKHSTSTSVKTTVYLYDGWNLLAEIEDHQDLKDGKNQSEASSLKPAPSLKSAKRYYTWGRDLSGSLQGVGGVGGQLAITKKVQNQEDSVMYPCYDANGNICQMISPQAEILAAYQYDAFGRTVDMAGEKAEENEWRFSTKPLDTATGWYYYGYRDYDPETGRWPSRDPIGEKGGRNLYAFVGNNPMIYFDRLGLDWTVEEVLKILCCAEDKWVVETISNNGLDIRKFEFGFVTMRKWMRNPDGSKGAEIPGPDFDGPGGSPPEPHLEAVGGGYLKGTKIIRISQAYDANGAASTLVEEVQHYLNHQQDPDMDRNTDEKIAWKKRLEQQLRNGSYSQQDIDNGLYNTDASGKPTSVNDAGVNNFIDTSYGGGATGPIIEYIRIEFQPDTTVPGTWKCK